MRLIVGVKRWAFVVGVAAVGAAFLGRMAGAWIAAPETPRPCQDSYRLVDSDSCGYVRCEHADQKLTIDRFDLPGPHMLVHCVCNPPARPVNQDGGR